MAATNNPDLVWSVTLDKRYIVKVERKSDYVGELIISEGDKELHRVDVGLSYRALFGPDVADVADWQEIAIKFVDSL